MPFNWTCPYCNSKTTITNENHSISDHSLDIKNSDGYRVITTKWIICPNVDCIKLTLTAIIFDGEYNQYNGSVKKGKQLQEINLIPSSQAKVFPDYIPKVLRNDYEEAAKIIKLSPKASATLSRRCLQGIIRDYWKISKHRLVDEINAIEDKIDPLTWKSIDAVRKVGNIGAHMEKDINIIVEVEENEAILLLELIELLFEEWYIHRHERELKLSSIVNLSESKEKLKNKQHIS